MVIIKFHVKVRQFLRLSFHQPLLRFPILISTKLFLDLQTKIGKITINSDTVAEGKLRSLNREQGVFKILLLFEIKVPKDVSVMSNLEVKVLLILLLIHSTLIPQKYSLNLICLMRLCFDLQPVCMRSRTQLDGIAMLNPITILLFYFTLLFEPRT